MEWQTMMTDIAKKESGEEPQLIINVGHIKIKVNQSTKEVGQEQQAISVPDARIAGIAYWDTVGSVAATTGVKLVFGALLGWLGPALAGRQHRFGIMAVTDSELVIVDLGTIAGEDLTPQKITASIAGRVSTKRVMLRDLTAECDSVTGRLILAGGLTMKATFPRSVGEENPSNAVLIASAITSHG